MSVIDQELAVVREEALLEVHLEEVVVIRTVALLEVHLGEVVVIRKKEEARQKVTHQQALKRTI